MKNKLQLNKKVVKICGVTHKLDKDNCFECDKETALTIISDYCIRENIIPHGKFSQTVTVFVREYREKIHIKITDTYGVMLWESIGLENYHFEMVFYKTLALCFSFVFISLVLYFIL